VGARLISHAGSLINLAKQPASTVQILGAEKALFRWVSVCVHVCVCLCMCVYVSTCLYAPHTQAFFKTCA